jgi:hypothetical protein
MLVVSITRLDGNTRVAPEVGALHDERAVRELGIREGPICAQGSSGTLFQRTESAVDRCLDGRIGGRFVRAGAHLLVPVGIGDRGPVT